MPSDPSRNALLHIRDNILLARRFVSGLDYDAFRDNEMVFYAVTRCLEITSEASRRLPEELKARHLDIPWREMAAAGMSIVTSMKTCSSGGSGEPWRSVSGVCSRS